MIVHTYNSNSQEDEEGEWRVGGQLGLHCKALSLKKKKKFNLQLSIWTIA
jgi:hypothetical protein